MESSKKPGNAKKGDLMTTSAKKEKAAWFEKNHDRIKIPSTATTLDMSDPERCKVVREAFKSFSRSIDPDSDEGQFLKEMKLSTWQQLKAYAQYNTPEGKERAHDAYFQEGGKQRAHDAWFHEGGKERAKEMYHEGGGKKRKKQRDHDAYLREGGKKEMYHEGGGKQRAHDAYFREGGKERAKEVYHEGGGKKRASDLYMRTVVLPREAKRKSLHDQLFAELRDIDGKEVAKRVFEDTGPGDNATDRLKHGFPIVHCTTVQPDNFEPVQGKEGQHIKTNPPHTGTGPPAAWFGSGVRVRCIFPSCCFRAPLIEINLTTFVN